LNQTHANVWKVISIFIDEEYHVYQKLALINTGAQKKPNPTARQIANENRKNKLYILYEKKTINLSELLEGLTFCVASNIRNSKKKKKIIFYIHLV
jgi:hypothetical protein